jgi:hypothetical protein
MWEREKKREMELDARSRRREDSQRGRSSGEN